MLSTHYRLLSEFRVQVLKFRADLSLTRENKSRCSSQGGVWEVEAGGAEYEYAPWIDEGEVLKVLKASLPRLLCDERRQICGRSQ